MTKSNKTYKAIFFMSLTAFILFAIYTLYNNQDVFYTAHDRSEYLVGDTFSGYILSKPFGPIQYIGSWLTQLFYYPALGTTALVALWAIIFVVGVKAFRLQGSAAALMLLPVACLLTSVVDLGYWIYIFTIRGYFFSQSVGYLLMLLLLWAARHTPRKWHIVWYIAGFCLFPILGWFALLFIISLALSQKPSWRELFSIIVLLFTAAIWHTLLYSNQKFDDVIQSGFPLFITPVDNSPALSVPFWVLGAATLFIALCGRYLNRWMVSLLSLVVSLAFTISLMYSDTNYIDEMRMVRHAENDNWKEVLQIASDNQHPTSSMVMLKNIALIHQGGLLDRSFKMGNKATDVNCHDSIHIGILNIASPLVYYNYGKMNYAIRLAYENAVSTGFSPFYLKILSRCALATGEQNLAQRFTTLLNHNLFYGDWHPSPVSKAVTDMQMGFANEINGVENNCERYISDNFSLMSTSESPVVTEQALFYSMVRCDSRRFWKSLRQYVKTHPNAAFPLHAQEAYIMYMDKSPEEKRIMLPVEQKTYDRYKKFWDSLESLVQSGVKMDDISSRLRGEYGDTYWYYNVFSRTN